MTQPVMNIEPPYKPELLPIVQYVVEHIMADGGDVFEYGSGHSTLWFAGFADVVTVEHDEEWYNEVVRALDEAGLEADHHLVPSADIPGVIDDYGMFDLILVDCWDDERIPAVMAAMRHVKPGGWLLLDDANWPQLAQARKVLSAWPLTIIRGVAKGHKEHQSNRQTNLYRKPL